ncbi:ABC transporter [Enterovibrio norvegicus]|uniref:ABC transporter permease n=1 Tax=Enterovibrio norvegicus TaxID=188144 RepID=UPI0002F60A05|nr:ABC transporter permease [Enterovibrio norvegicus]OEF51351.1 ABC transporter [Enterovibrio norvegicus]
MAIINKRSKIEIFKDVIFAIFVRDIKSNFNDKLGLSWSVVSPLLFIMVLTLIRGSMDGGETHTMPTYYFMAYGILLVRFFMECTTNVSNAIANNKSLFSFRQVQPSSAFIASSLFELISKFLVAIIIIFIGFMLNVESALHNSLGILYIFMLTWLMSVSVGIFFALARCYVPEVTKIRSFILRPLIFLSGAFFSLKDIPMEYWHFFTWNPILHSIEFTRDFSSSTYNAEGVSFLFLNMTTFSMLFIAMCCYQAVWKKAISR